MREETLSLLAIRPDGVFVDATAGMGGHTGMIARRLSTGLVIANDRDAESLEMARQNTADCAARIRFQEAKFSTLAETIREAGYGKVDGLIADLGVSRYQLTAAERDRKSVV